MLTKKISLDFIAKINSIYDLQGFSSTKSYIYEKSKLPGHSEDEKVAEVMINEEQGTVTFNFNL